MISYVGTCKEELLSEGRELNTDFSYLEVQIFGTEFSDLGLQSVDIVLQILPCTVCCW